MSAETRILSVVCVLGTMAFAFSTSAVQAERPAGAWSLPTAFVIMDPIPRPEEVQAGAPTRMGESTVVWDNGPDLGICLASSQLDEVYPFHSGVADDFLLREQNPDAVGQIAITGIAWIGGFWCGEPAPLDGVNIYVYANAPGADLVDGGDAPTGGPVDPTPTALMGVYLAAGEFIQTPLPDGYRMEGLAELPEPFLAEPDARYWIEIQGVLPVHPCYGWAAGEPMQGWGGTQGFPLIEVPYWSRVEGDCAGDFAFTLFGEDATESDVDRDGDVDMADLRLFLSCFSGEGVPFDHDRIICHRSSLDGDEDVDLWDFFGLYSQLLGPEP